MKEEKKSEDEKILLNLFRTFVAESEFNKGIRKNRLRSSDKGRRRSKKFPETFPRKFPGFRAENSGRYYTILSVVLFIGESERAPH